VWSHDSHAVEDIECAHSQSSGGVDGVVFAHRIDDLHWRYRVAARVD